MMSRSGHVSEQSPAKSLRHYQPETRLSLHLITDGLPVRSRPRGKVVATYILRRLGLALVTLWLLSVIVFFAGQVLPGDPGRAILGNLASPSAVAALDHQLGVDRPLVTQYWSWITGVVHGD